MSRLTQNAKRIAHRPLDTLDVLGDQMSFYLRALAWVPRTIRRYTREVMRLLAEVSFGSGSLAMIGGTVGVMVGLTLFTGVLVGLQGYSALNSIGTSAFTGFLTSFFNTREIAPLVAGLALSATVGSGFTAQLGAMRISEEIDALEVMGVPSLPYLVTTRILAGFVAVVPLYVVGLLSSYLASRTVVVHLYGQSAGTYDHYFDMFLPPEDVLYSFIKVLIFSVLIILTHCYYGYRASGGPAGVGIAVGRAVRLSIVTVAVVNFFIGFALWGTDTTVRIAG
ncbi:MlaE family ABC transporter permease [Saccharomonospora saliphila]|uniref:MlaE family ABC transporter permease n=1 Tax=Saccharomonospora saliphila TaxID=369829 RepID=UPI00036B9D66|nr:ABC transporter permease [Saccharomonospora saliphila]